MKWWMVLAVVFTVVRAADAETVIPGTIDLQIQNDASVPAQTVEQCQDELTRIFGDAGLTLRWTELTPRFTVHIVSQVLGYGRASSPVMGVALRSANGSTAQIFFRQVQDFARAYHMNVSTMLAYVIAHEIGHLLLPGAPHSPTGLMQAEWDKALVQNASRRSLTFTDTQAARIRASR